MDIQNKTAFITGGTTGIGLATARALMEKGANVVLFSKSLYKEKIPDLVKNPRVLLIKGDVTKPRHLRAAVAKTLKKFGSLDILDNNAAIADRKLFKETTPQDWDEAIEVNIKGPLLATQEVLPIMLKQKSGLIINIASGAGEYGIGGLSLYSLTKAALINFTQSLSQEVQDAGISVVTVAPGSTNTRMYQNLFGNRTAAHTPEFVAEVIVRTIEGTITPDEKMIVDVFKHSR